MPHQPTKPLEEIVREVGRYPLDAFLFVQECIGLASERIHGPLSSEQRTIASWMAQEDVGPDELLQRWESGDLPQEITAAIEQVGGPQCMNRHVTGQELCWVIRDVALERWGLMARGVLAQWNIRQTEDLGAIVFALVEHQWLAKQPSDSVDDFKHVYSFAEVFDKQYQIGQ